MNLKNLGKGCIIGGLMISMLSPLNVLVYADDYPMNAQWDQAPVIYPAINKNNEKLMPDFNTNTNISYGELQIKDENGIFRSVLATFLENEQVSIEDLLKLVSAEDKEDGDISHNIRVAKIDYGKTKSGYQPESMISPEAKVKLDTYFMHLEKDETVDIKVTYQVTDSGGNISNQTATIKVKYNNPPEIKAEYLAYVDSELISDGEKVLKEIRENGKATDIEDDKSDKKLSLSITKPKPLTLDYIKDFGDHDVTYSVTDSLGKTTTKTTQVYVTSASPYDKDPLTFVRFINKKYLYTVDKESMWHKDNHPELYQKLVDMCENAEKEHPDVKYTFTITTGDYKD